MDIIRITTTGVPMNPRNPEVARIVVDVPSGCGDGGNCGGRSLGGRVFWAILMVAAIVVVAFSV